jgi:predicted metal-binding membrane protein
VSESGLEAVLRRDRMIVCAALATVALIAWVYIIHLARQMNMGSMDMRGFRMAATAAGMVMTPTSQPWNGSEFTFTLAMWVIMMIGMMTPSATPIMLLHARVGRQAAEQGKPFADTGWFLSGYLLAWIAFSFAATTAQWGLDRAALLSPSMATASAIFSSIVLIGAGIYQWTPLKDKCLVHCQSPMQFILQCGGFRRDFFGSIRLGVDHGLYCVGCCWALMALLFVGGVMNLLWIAVISFLVLAEKVVPTGRLIPRVSGILFAAAGIWVILR